VASEADASAGSADESVVLASFANRAAAEHMLASLGREFRKKFRKGDVAAFVVSGNADGSLKLTESRVLSTSGVVSALIRISLAWTVGLLGLFSTLKGAKSEAHAIHLREAHVGSDEQAAHAILAEAGPDAAVAMVCCKDQETRDAVTQRAAERAIRSWDGSRTEFLAGLDRGPKHDWVRAALGEPSSTNR
jgi:hypothetical protein